MLTINVLCPGLCTSPAVATTSYPNKSLEFDWTIWVSSKRNIQVGFFVWLVVDNKKPPPMSTVHTHTSWDWPMTHHEEQWPLPCPHMGADAEYGQETSADSHWLPLCSFVQQSSKCRNRTLQSASNWGEKHPGGCFESRPLNDKIVLLTLWCAVTHTKPRLLS